MSGEVQAAGEQGGFLAAMGDAAMSLEAAGGSLVAGVAAILPAFPAARFTDLSLNIMHGHPHPPTFGTPLPSTGPVLSIPIFSTASTVLINGLTAARAGDMGIGAWCGGYFPMYEVFTGSSNVYIESSRASRMLIDFTKHCIFTSRPSPPPSDPPVGNFIGNLITGSPNVQIGGAPFPSLFSIFLGAALSGLAKLAGKGIRAVARLARKAGKQLGKNMKPGFIKCAVLKAEPVNVITGEVIVEQQDFLLRGRIPLKWNRRYSSHNPRRGVCGQGWETPADARLQFEEDGTAYFVDGSTPGAAIFPSLPVAGPVLELVDGATLDESEGVFSVRTKAGLVYRFSKGVSPQKELLADSVSDLCGNTITFVRDRGELREIQDGSGRRIEVICRDRLIEQLLLHHPAEPEPRLLARYAYDEWDNLTTVFDPLGAPCRFFYSDHRLVQHSDRNGLSFYYQYEQVSGEQKCVRSFGDNGLYDYKFEYAAGQTRITNSLGHTWTVEYDDALLPIKEVDPLRGVTVYEYDEAGRTTAVVDPDGNRTEYRYDDRGNLLKVTRADGKAIVTEFNAANKPVRITEANGAVWQKEWDSRHLLSAHISPSGAESRYEYDSRGDLVACLTPLGSRMTLAFDDYRNLLRLTDALGQSSEFTYDALGNVTAISDSRGPRIQYAYDAKGRLTQTILPNGVVTICGYDPEDKLVLYQDENGAVTKTEYCGLGEVKRCLQSDGHTVEYLYDTEERLIGVVNQRGERYQIRRDPLGRVVEEIDYWGQRWQYTYTPAGHKQQSIDPLGRIIRYHTDSLGRVLKSVHWDPLQPNAPKEQTFAYDAEGHLIFAENDTIRISRQFDLEGRLLEEHQGEQCVISYTYDLAGRRISRTTKIVVNDQTHATTVLYSYNSLDGAVGIEVVGYPPVRLTRNALGQISEERLGSQVRRRLFYNGEGRRSGQQFVNSLRPIFDQSYTYDAASNLIEKRDSAYGVEKATYDPLSRLIAYVDPDGHVTRYLTDPAGDRLGTSLLERSEPGPGDELWSREGEYAGVHYRFDRAGNLVSRSDGKCEIRLIWNADQQLVATANRERTTTYGYDPLGRRVIKQTGDSVSHFYWEDDALVAELTTPGGPQIESTKLFYEWVYYPGTFEPLAMLQRGMGPDQAQQNSRGKLYFYLNDPNGAPTRVVAEDGQIVWSANYDAWGKARRITVNRVYNPLRLQGQYYDPETDLCFNRARYYDPSSGSFISQDPLGLAGGLNLYQYAPNVWRWTDPLGLQCSIHYDYAAALARELFERSQWMRAIQRMARIEDDAARYLAMEQFSRAYSRRTGIAIHVVPKEQAAQYGLVGRNWGTYRPAERRIYMNEAAWTTRGVNPLDELGHEVGAAELDRVMGIPKDAIPRVHGGGGPYLTHIVDMMY